MSTTDPLSWMDEEPEALAATGDTPAAPETNAPAQEEPANAQPTPEAPAAPAAGAEPEISPTPKEGFVPLAALLDERDKRKALETAAKATAAPAAEPEPVVIPDSATDPVGYAAHVETTIQQSIMNERLNVSQRFAVKEKGQEYVDKVQAWAMPRFETDAAFAARVFGSTDPYGEAIAIYEEEQTIAALKDVPVAELEQFRAWRAANPDAVIPAATGQNPAQSQPAAAPAAAPQPVAAAKPPAPPKSINDATNAGGGAADVAAGPGRSFDSVFAN